MVLPMVLPRLTHGMTLTGHDATGQGAEPQMLSRNIAVHRISWIRNTQLQELMVRMHSRLCCAASLGSGTLVAREGERTWALIGVYRNREELRKRVRRFAGSLPIGGPRLSAIGPLSPARQSSRPSRPSCPTRRSTSHPPHRPARRHTRRRTAGRPASTSPQQKRLPG